MLSAIFWGIGVGGSSSAAAAYAADQAPPGANGVTMGIYRMVSDAGYVVGGLVAGVAADLIGFGGAIGVVAALTGASGLWVALELGRPQPSRKLAAAPAA